MNDTTREDLLTDTELALYVISQDIPGDAKDALSDLRIKVLNEPPIATSHAANLVVHVDAALKALHSNYDYRLASWHLWKIHRALTGRTW